MVSGHVVNISTGACLPEQLHLDEHVLLWLCHGAAQVRCHDEIHRLASGEAMLIDAGTTYQVDVATESSLFPILIPVGDAADLPNSPTRYALGPQWNDWLLHHFVAWRTPIRSLEYRPAELVSNLNRSETMARMPRSAAAREVALALHRHPASRLTVDEWAEQASVSVRTLTRLFVRETGMSFAEWRTDCRLQAAAEHLQAGRAVGWTARQVGFESVTWFIRAFARRFGCTPGAWSRTHRDTSRCSERIRSSERNRTLVSRLNGETSFHDPPPVPATSVTPCTHDDVSLVWWMYKGTSHAKVGERTLRLSQGDAIWMPARVEHAIELEPDSIGLPLVFYADEPHVSPDDGAVIRVPPGSSDVVLFHVMANLTFLHPSGYERLEILDFLVAHGLRQRELALAMPTDPVARHVARHLGRRPQDTRPLADWAAQFGIAAAELNEVFREETGRSFAAWRAAARMQVASDMISRGIPPSAVARRLGYRHLSGFSRDFTRHHGMSPRAYRG